MQQTHKKTAYDDSKIKQTFDEVKERDRIHVEKICNDDMYAYNFFYKKCKPLFSSIIWTIYGNDADYDELVNDLYLYLKSPNAEGEYWHNLLTFDYRTSLFDWIKTVAIRHFYTPSVEVFGIPEILKDTSLLEDMIRDMNVAVYRKYMWNTYVDNKSRDEVCTLLGVNDKEFKKISRCAIKHFKNIVSNNYPEYAELFSKNKSKELQTEQLTTINTYNVSSPNEELLLEVKLDVNKQISLMPNKRYRDFMFSFFIEGRTLDELSTDFQTSLDNIYNLKMRSIDQFQDVYLFTGEFGDIEVHLQKITNDRSRQIVDSIFVQKKSYDELLVEMGLTESQLKKEKKAAIKELKRLIFNKK